MVYDGGYINTEIPVNLDYFHAFTHISSNWPSEVMSPYFYGMFLINETKQTQRHLKKNDHCNICKTVHRHDVHALKNRLDLSATQY